MIQYIRFGLSTTFVFSVFNVRHLIDGPGPGFYEFILSMIFLFTWGFYGFLKGRSRQFSFYYFATFFWGMGLIMSLFTINMHMFGRPVMIISFLFIAPVTGFLYLLDIYGQPLVFFNTILPMIISVLGYKIGQKVSEKS